MKNKSAFTTKSGVLKCFSLVHYRLSAKMGPDSTRPLSENTTVVVYPCVYSNDGTALKVIVEYDPVSKTNVGLTVIVDITFVKENNPPDPEKLKYLIITVAVPGSITTLDNKTSIPVLMS